MSRDDQKFPSCELESQASDEASWLQTLATDKASFQLQRCCDTPLIQMGCTFGQGSLARKPSSVKTPQASAGISG